MSKHLKGKKRKGAAMSSEGRITKGDASEDALLTESALLGPDNPTNAGGGGKDEQEGKALVIPEKAEVREKMMNEPEVTVKKGFTLIRANGAHKPPVGKRWAPSGTALRLKAIRVAKEEEKKKKGGAAMSSVLSDNTSSSESATLEPTIAGKGKPDKERGCDILADISDHQRTLKSKHAKRDKLRCVRVRRFKVRVVIFLNYMSSLAQLF